MKNIKTQNSLNLNKFFSDIKLKKQYIKKLKSKYDLLSNFKKNYKNLSLSIFSKSCYKNSIKESFLVSYIIDITFSRTNTLLHVMDFSGNLKFFCSAGLLKYKGKSKKRARYLIFKNMFRILNSKLKFFKSQPLALHLKNVGSAKFWIVKKFLKKKLFVKIIKSYDLYPYNGCRKKKVRRKKIRIKLRKKKKWLSGLKRQTVNLLSFLIAGSNPAFFKNVSDIRNITQR
jgi:ribosomal protein S11